MGGSCFGKSTGFNWGVRAGRIPGDGSGDRIGGAVGDVDECRRGARRRHRRHRRPQSRRRSEWNPVGATVGTAAEDGDHCRAKEKQLRVRAATGANTRATSEDGDCRRGGDAMLNMVFQHNQEQEGFRNSSQHLFLIVKPWNHHGNLEICKRNGRRVVKQPQGRHLLGGVGKEVSRDTST